MNEKFVVNNNRLYIDNKIALTRGYCEEMKQLEDDGYIELIVADMSDFATLYVVGVKNETILESEKYFNLLKIAIKKGQEYNY